PMKTIAVGLGVGVVFSVISWLENLRVMSPFVASVFPDLITFIALPALILMALSLVSPASETLSRSDVRRVGMIMVVTGAVLFSISHVLVGIVRFPQPITSLSFFGFSVAFIGFVAIGAITVWVASTWIVREDTTA